MWNHSAHSTYYINKLKKWHCNFHNTKITEMLMVSTYTFKRNVLSVPTLTSPIYLIA